MISEDGSVVSEHNSETSLKSKSVCSNENAFVHYIICHDFKKYRLDLECENTKVNSLDSIYGIIRQRIQLIVVSMKLLLLR